MLGTFRFFLALMVTLEHFMFIKGFHPGVIAVVSFYMLAGYVMAYSFKKNFNNDLRSVPRFYLDRGLRIFPLYWIVSFIILIIVIATNAAEVHLTFTNILSTITLAPLNYWMYLPKIYSLNHNSFPIPPAPSLALELHFYLLCPFLIVFRKLRFVAFVASLVIFFLAAKGILHSYYFGYALLPGTLYIFVMGIYLYEFHREGKILEGFARKVIIGASAIVTLYMIYFAIIQKLMVHHTIEIIFGFFISIIAILAFGKVDYKSKFDHYLGMLSYPLFLSHFLVIWVVNRYLRENHTSDYYFDTYSIVVLKLVCVIPVAMIFYHFFEKPFQKLRKRIQVN